MQFPPQIAKNLVDFFKRNQGAEETEHWPPGNTYVNHWDSPTYILSLSNPKLRGVARICKAVSLNRFNQHLKPGQDNPWYSHHSMEYESTKRVL